MSTFHAPQSDCYVSSVRGCRPGALLTTLFHYLKKPSEEQRSNVFMTYNAVISESFIIPGD